MNEESYFDEKTIQALKTYVYLLVDREASIIFYVGKGKGNRVFHHLDCALENGTESLKFDRIRLIKANNGHVDHYIVRHGLDDVSAFLLESSLLDIFSSDLQKLNISAELTNIQSGHHSDKFGLMPTKSIKMLYAAEELKELNHPAVLININYQYSFGKNEDELYEATRKSWLMAAWRTKSVKFVLAEYRGLIIEVYEVEKWEVNRHETVDGKNRTRWEFTGKIADKLVRDQYYMKSVAHLKKRGARNPLRYTI